MRLSVPTVFGTILALSALEVVASSSAAAGRVGGALQGLGTAARYIMSPSMPLIPDLRTHRGPGIGVASTPIQSAAWIPSLPPIQG